MKKTVLGFISLASVLLVACGGGGGGSTGPVASTNSFNLQTAFIALDTSGFSKTFTISGSCSGSIAIVKGPVTTPTTFESTSAFSGSDVTTANFSNCSPASSVTTETVYVNNLGIPLGYSTQGGKYGVFSSTPNIPASVRVGDVAVVGSENLWTNSTKATIAGRKDISFVIEADTASTAIVNLIFKTYDAGNVLQLTEQDRYRINANNTLTLISLDAVFANTIHLIGN